MGLTPLGRGACLWRSAHVTALRLARYFGTTPGFWMGIQTQYDLERAQDGLTGELERIAPEKQEAS